MLRTWLGLPPAAAATPVATESVVSCAGLPNTRLAAVVAGLLAYFIDRSLYSLSPTRLGRHFLPQRPCIGELRRDGVLHFPREPPLPN